MPVRHLIIAFLSWFLSGAAALLTLTAQAAGLNVQLIMSDSSPPYRQFATAFNQALAANNADIVVTESPLFRSSDADLIVTVGMRAAELAMTETDLPVLAVMLPKVGYNELLVKVAPEKPAREISAIYLDQPWDRQLDFLQAALPDRRRIGLLYSSDTRLDIARLRRDVAKRGGSLVSQAIRSAEEIFPGLETILNDSDVLLAIADSTIYSNSNIRNILLTNYRHGVPLVGFSLSYVNAGALCAIFSTPEQLAEQAGSSVIFFARTRRLPESQYPVDFTVAVNQQVAQSLGIKLPAQETIRDRINAVAQE